MWLFLFIGGVVCDVLKMSPITEGSILRFLLLETSFGNSQTLELYA